MGGPKSLNVGYRKRETERIERENHAFAKRLFDKQANLSKKKLDVEYKTHLQYKKQIQKLKKKKSDKKGDFGKTEDLQGEQQSRSKSVDHLNEISDKPIESVEGEKLKEEVTVKEEVKT